MDSNDLSRFTLTNGFFLRNILLLKGNHSSQPYLYVEYFYQLILMLKSKVVRYTTEPASEASDLCCLLSNSELLAGSPASFQALIPPITSVAFSKPISCNAYAARLHYQDQFATV